MLRATRMAGRGIGTRDVLDVGELFPPVRGPCRRTVEADGCHDVAGWPHLAGSEMARRQSRLVQILPLSK